MPTEYTVDFENQIVTTVIGGIVTIEELMEYFHRARHDERTAEFNRLHILRSTNVGKLSTVDFRTLASLGKQLWGTGKFRVAVVASSDAEFGMTRMFISMRERPVELLRVFRTLEDARAWLLSDSSRTQSEATDRGDGFQGHVDDEPVS